ncbi:restriction endonuclease [Streptomyces sp. NPDC058001]|uniref:restriction endonuclease n=1 Tax=Streptomyces sp. NPDC058001 TaxID=3346300 RepID=UPI0036F15530
MDIAVGAERRRAGLHVKYGGNPQSGISHSASTPVVMCFINHKRGARFGYQDGWADDGFFHYTGEGQVGDQKMSSSGNKAILNHAVEHRGIYLFESVSKGVVAYRGQYELPSEDAWYRAEARDRDGDMRSVIIFKLRPCTPGEQTHEPRISHMPAATTTVTDVAPEQFIATRSSQTPNRKPTTAHRRESALLSSYTKHLTKRGHQVCRKKITPRGERDSLFTDLFNLSENLLVEAKGQATRESIRMAIGQLFDYERYISPRPRLAILVPSRPRQDLRDLCAALSIQTIWPGDRTNTFEAEPPAPSTPGLSFDVS